MSDYNNNNKEFASSGVGTAGLTLGVIGTALASGILGNGGFGGLFGGNSSAQNEMCQLRMQNAILTSEASASEKLNKGLTEVYTELRKQDKLQDQNLANLNSRVLAIETAAPLKEQIVDGKFAQVYDKITCCCNSANAAIQSTNTAIANLQNNVNALYSMTSLKINAENVCPLPMARFNNWQAPTSTTTEG